MNKIIFKYNKKDIIIFAISILAIFISVIFYNYFNGKPQNLFNEAKDYKTVISNNEEKEGDAVYVEITDIPYLVATETTDNSKLEYYVVYDENNYAYITLLKKGTYNKICDEYNKDKNNFKYVISGRLKNVPEDLEKIIIDEFNEVDDSIELTRFNYNKYFGTTYLDENTLSSQTVALGITELCIVVAVIASLIYLIILIKGYINIKRTLSNVDKAELENELSNSNLQEYSNAKILLLDRYFVSMHCGMRANEYTDIAWVYISHNTRTKLGTYSLTYTINNESCLMIYLKNGKKYTTARVKNKKANDYVQIINELVKRNPKLMVGYTFDNLNTYNKMV